MTVSRDCITVLHVMGALRPSGMERMLVSAAPSFDKLNVRTIVLGQGLDHSYVVELQNSGYDVRVTRSVAKSFGDVRRLHKLVRDLRVDVIHIHTEANYLRNAFVCWWAVRKRRGVVVRTIHSVFDAKGKWLLSRRFQALLADRLMFCLIAPSPGVAEKEQSLGRKVTIIYNWIDDRIFEIAKFRRLSNSAGGLPTIALLVGNCSEVKNHEMALSAIDSAGHMLIHVGDESGASEEELRILEALQKEGRILSRGPQLPDDGLRRAQYFALPSRREGMGVALAEALVAGLPAVVTDAPGLRWAKGLAGVTTVPGSQENWNETLIHWGEHIVPGAQLEIDFTARRGVGEYVTVYQTGLRSRAASVAGFH